MSSAPAGGPVDGGAVKREDPSQICPAVAKHFDPEVREAIAHTNHGARSASGGHGGRGDSHGGGDPAYQRGKIGTTRLEMDGGSHLSEDAVGHCLRSGERSVPDELTCSPGQI